MSRIGNAPIKLVSNVEVTTGDQEVQIKSGSIVEKINIPKNIQIEMTDSQIQLNFTGSKNDSTAQWGTFRQLLNNTIQGFSKGFSKKVSFKGTGYKAEVKNNIVKLFLGHSHSFFYIIPQNVKIEYDKAANALNITSHSKKLLGDVVSEIVSLRPPEPYKGKGVIEEGRYIVRKESKSKK